MQQDLHIGDELAAFLEGGVSVVVSAGDGASRPVVGRALGCRISPDRRQITLYLSATANEELLVAAARTGAVAVVLTEPSSHRSVQVKGLAARVAPPEEDVAPILSRHTEAFRRNLERIGFDEAFTRVLMAFDPGDLVTLSFVPCGAFTQTPGAGAGSALDS